MHTLTKFALKITLLVCLFVLCSVSPSLAIQQKDLDLTLESFRLIGLSELHERGIKGRGQVVVFIDSGVDSKHPYLNGAVVDGYCSAQLTCGPYYLKSGIAAGGIFGNVGANPHGMGVAGIIAGRPYQNFPGGIAPEASLISISNDAGNDDGLISAFDWILKAKELHNIVAVVGSFATTNSAARNQPDGCDYPNKTLMSRIRMVYDSGISLVFASGNGGNLVRADFPACLPFAISAGAVSSTGEIKGYSNVSGKTVFAPADIISAGGGTSFIRAEGTSNSAPAIGGSIALIKQVFPNATPVEVKQALFSSTKSINDGIWQNLPILNVPSALKALEEGKFNERFPVAKLIEDPVTQRALLEQEKRVLESKISVAKIIEESQSAEISTLKRVLSELKLSNAFLEGKIKFLQESISKLELEIEKLEPLNNSRTISCIKGKTKLKVSGERPSCPAGYRKV